METTQYRVTSLDDVEQLRQCIEIQRVTWGFSDEDILPLRTLVVCSKIGGHVLGAVDKGGTVLGFVNAIPGCRNGRVFLHSHMMGVRPEYQNRGIGKRLKLAQRDEALGRGIRTIEWTFDPLEIRNARFNIELLGVICRRYLVNVYGVTTSRLHGGLPTDRLVAEWLLDSAIVDARCNTKPRGANSGLEVGPVAEGLSSAAKALSEKPMVARIELPLEIGKLKSTEPAKVLELQLRLRDRMLELFSQSLVIAGFTIDSASRTASYWFSPESPQA